MNEIVTNENYERACRLHSRIVINAQAAQESLFAVCKDIKEMRDSKLYKELGYEKINQYAKAELGMTDRNVRRYVSVAEMVEQKRTPVSANIGISKLYLLSTLTEEEREAVEESTDLETVSKRDLEEKIKQIEAEKHSAELEAEQAKALSEKVCQLEEQIKELEARPVDVAVEKDPDAEKKLAEKEQQLKDLQKQLKEAKKSIKDGKAAADKAVQEALDKQAAEHKSETDKLTAEKAELERQLAVKPKEIRVTVDEDKVTFKIKLSTAYEALMPAAQFAASSGNDEFKAKLNALLDAARKVVEGNG
ncbi:MAG: hypothetical protein IKO27_08180 [Ruminococcus sp.]|nr:hypothetical protein [Ruminococcus sp.]